jgi:NAD(P)H-hydrate repair Nnr-like enzyme with NAD(P)H-hydrate dehydratase domain
MDLSYWHKQTDSKAKTDTDWYRPERRDQAGKLGIVGGNKLNFIAVAEAYQTSINTGAGEIRVLLPDSLKNIVPKTISDILYSPSTAIGGLAKDASLDLTSLTNWADGLLFIGDAGRNAETAILYENFITSSTIPITIARDAIDLVKNSSHALVEREQTIVVASFAQLQKLFQAVYFPKIVTFNMQLLQLVETLHKFTITYPCTIVTLHNDTLIIADKGEVYTIAWSDTMAIWRGSVATKIATFWLWQPGRRAQAILSSLGQ